MDFKLIKKIGEGGMSSVWKAWDNEKSRVVALKILNDEFASSGADIRAFRNEERLLEEIQHPGIVAAYDFDFVDGHWCFMMEYVDGYSFSDYLNRKGFVREEDCLLICESVAAALNYAWNDHGIVHCDIKPENIMINCDGEVKLMDLGISKRFHEVRKKTIKQPDHIMGTPAYISPEQIYADAVLDCRADIYSLAATLYHLATGRILFPGLDTKNAMAAHCSEPDKAPDPRTFRPELSEGFCQLLEFMLVKDRNYRVSTWAQVFQMAREVECGVKFKPRLSNYPSSMELKKKTDVV